FSQKLAQLGGGFADHVQVLFGEQDQERRMADADVIEGRRVGESLRACAEGVRPFFVKLVALRAADGDHSFDAGKGKVVSLEIAFVGGKKSREATTGGMAGNKNGIGSAAVLGDVTNGPSKGAGHILDVCGMLYRG